MGDVRFVWLACQSQAATAVSRAVSHDATLFLGAKLRQLLTAVPDLRSKLDDDEEARAVCKRRADAKNEYHKRLEAIRRCFSSKIVGLAIVEVGAVYRGVLSPLDIEQRSILEFAADSSKRVGSVFLRVLDAIALSEASSPVVSGAKSYANHKSFVMTHHGIQHLMGSVATSGRTMTEHLSDWCSEEEYRTGSAALQQNGLGPPCAVVVASALALLTAHGFISSLVFTPGSRYTPNPYLNPLTAKIRALSRCNDNGSALAALPADDVAMMDREAAQVLETECANLAEGELDRDMLLSIAKSLRQYVQLGSLRECPAELQVGADASLDIQRQLVWLEGFWRASAKDQVSRSRLQRSSKGFQGVWDNDMGCNVTYKPAFLLQCVVLSFNLRSSHNLPETIHAALNCLPDIWKQTLQRLIEDARTPSASTLSRARLSVDVSFMLWMRSRHARLLQDPQLTVFVKVDSTPLGGNNWEVVEYQLVEGENLGLAGHLATVLADMGARCATGEMSVQDAEKYHQTTQDLASLVSHHVLPLGALGTRRASIAHIAHSILFRLRLECFSWQDVDTFVNRTFSLTADQGTEGKLGDIESINLQDNFPWWPVAAPVPEFQGNDRQADAADAEEENDELCVFQLQQPEALNAVSGFVSSLRIPPHFHIIDKVSNSLLAALSLSWSRVEKGFKAVVACFHAGHTRRHFVKLCVPANVQFLFSGGPPAWDGGRVWGVLQRIVHWLLKREGAIKRNFDIEALLNKAKQTVGEAPAAGGEGEAGDVNAAGNEDSKRDYFDDRDGSNMSICGDAVKDPFFWGAMHLLGKFAEILDHMHAWMLGCACHPPHVREELQTVLGRKALDAALQCPMRGRRGPDLAVGRHRAVFQQMAHEQEDILFMVHLAALSENDRRDLMLDFAAGRARLATELEVRLSVWDTLPLKLFALGYHDADVAREALVQCCVQFEELTEQEQQSEVHVLTTRLLSHNGEHRQQLVQFLQGQDLSQQLQCIADQMILTPTLEISVERLHAFLKQRTLATHHISGAYASLQLRKPEILTCHRHHFDELAECCALAASPSAIVEALELTFYPDFLPYHHDGDGEGDGQAAGRLRSCVPHSLVDAVIYRRHLDMQYMQLPQPHVAKRKRATTSAPVCRDMEDASDHVIAYEHFRATFDSSRFYAVSKVAADSESAGALTHDQVVEKFFLPLGSALRGDGSGRDEGALKRLQLELTGDEHGLPFALMNGGDAELAFPEEELPRPPSMPDVGGVVAQQARDTRVCRDGEYVFFRVVDARPSRRKRLRTDLMKSISSSHLAVTIHEVLHADAAGKKVTVAMRASGSEHSAARLFDGSVDAKKIFTWDIDEDVVWLWRGHEAEAWLNAGAVPAVLGMLFAAKAWAGVGKLPVSSDEEDVLAALRMLRDVGLVQRLEPEGEQEQWQLLDSARYDLSCGARLCNIQSALRVRPDQPPHAMTLWELLQSLRQDGFEQHPIARAAEPFNVQRNGPKKCYSVGGKWCRAYLEILVRRRELPHQGIKSVPHGCKASLYKAMLDSLGGGKKRRAKPLRLQFVGEDGLLDPAANVVAASRNRAVSARFGARVAQVAAATEDDRAAAGVGPVEVDGDEAPESGAPPPPPAAPVSRRRNAKTHYWPHESGPCLLTFKPPQTWQATCPRVRSHRNPDRPKTKCTRTMSFSMGDEGVSEERVLRTLRYWLSKCRCYDTRTQHMEFRPSLEEIPDDAAVAADACVQLPAGYSSEPEGAGAEGAALAPVPAAPKAAPRRRCRRKTADVAAELGPGPATAALGNLAALASFAQSRPLQCVLSKLVYTFL